MPILGINTVYGNTSGGANGRKLCTRTNTVAPSNGTTVGIYLYVHDGNPATNTGKLAVYDENGNLRSGYGGTFSNATPGTWAFVPFTQPIVSGSTYRPCYMSNGTVGTTYEFTGSQDQGYTTYSVEPTATLAGLSQQDATISMYIDYTTTSASYVNLSGSTAELTSAYGYPNGLGNLSGSTAELTSAYGYLNGLGNLSGSTAEITSAYGYPNGLGNLSGSTAELTSAYGYLSEISSFAGSSNIAISAYGYPNGLGNLSGSTAELTSAYGYPNGLGNLSGSTAELTSAYGYLSEFSVFQGSSSILTSAYGYPNGLGNLSGSTAELTSAYGYISNGAILGTSAFIGVSATYGNFSIGVVDRKLCTLTNVVAQNSGQTTGMYIYVHSGNSSTNRGKVAVYDENGNLRSGYGGEFVNATPGTWVFVPFTQPIVSGSTYRPCYISDGTVGTTYESIGSQDQGFSQVGYANEPSVSLSNLAYQNYTISMYIAYEYAPIMVGTATVSTSALGRLSNEYYSGNLRIYCIGSSTTAGFPDPSTGGYRSLLQDLLRFKYDFDFVGSQVDGPIGYDNNHSGIGGMNISGCYTLIQSELSTYMSNFSFNQEGYVVLQIGDADVYFDSNLSNYPAYATNYIQIIDFIHNFNPNIRVICVNSKPIPSDSSATNRANYLNQLTIPGIVERSSYALYCDIFTSIINTPNWESTLYAEPTHLSTSGYNLVADTLFEIFDSIFAETFIHVTTESILNGKGSVSGSTNEITSAYGYPSGLLNLLGTSIELTSAYGTSTGLGNVSGSSIELTSAYGYFTGLLSLSGTSTEFTSAYSYPNGLGNLSGSSTELTSAYSYPTGLGNLSGISIEVISTNGNPTGLGNLSGSTSIYLQLDGILDGVESTIFYSYVTSILSGNITGLGNVSGSTHEITSAYSYPNGLGNLSGSSIELTSAYGYPSGLVDISGVSNILVDISGVLSSDISYNTNISINANGILNGILNLNGQLNSIIDTNGILNGILNFSGATSINVSAFSQDGTLVTILSGDKLQLISSNRLTIRTSLFDNYTTSYNGMSNNTNMPNGFITKCSPIYNNERNVYSSLLTEAYNQHGVCMTYYITTWDVNYDKIFGEDNNRRFERIFNMMGYFQLPREEKLWSKFGIEGLDEFSVFVSKKHFRDASTFGNSQVVGNVGQNTYSNYVPKIGDIIQSQYNKYLYEITEVKEESGMFLLSKQHSWEFVVRPYKDEHINLSSATSASMTDIVDYTNKTDIFDITSAVNQQVQDIKYTPKPTEKSNNDPFAGW